MGRILFIASTFSHIQNFHLPYLREFARRGWQVDVACGGAVQMLPEARQCWAVALEKSMTSPKNLIATRQLRTLIRENRYDIISCHTALASFFARLAVMGLKHRPQVACTCHGYLFDQDTSLPKRVVLSTAERLTAPVTDLLMTMNQWDTQYAQAHALGRRIVQIPGMGLDPARLPAVAPAQISQLRARLHLPQGAFVLLFAGEFSHRKSQSVLLHALAQLPEQVYLLLPGQGSQLQACRQLAQQLGVSQRVRFPGQVEDMPVFYAACDAVVSASRIEGLPFNIMEAMYYARPIVASNVKGHCDLLQPQQAGMLYPYADAQACARHISSLMAQPHLAQAMGQRARQALTPYLLEPASEQIMAWYQKLLFQEGSSTL